MFRSIASQHIRNQRIKLTKSTQVIRRRKMVETKAETSHIGQTGTQQTMKAGKTGSGLPANLSQVFRNYRGPQGDIRVTIEYTSPNHCTVSVNNVLTPTMVQNKPRIKIDTSQKWNYYTLMLIDPDAPSRDNPTNAQWCHWLVCNIPGTTGNVDQGEECVGYVGAGPPKGSGYHRYIFALFGHSNKVSCDMRISKTSSKGRSKFNGEEFARKHNIGDPIWMNSFEAEWDSYVPTLYQNFKD